jgi:putative copper export protein
MVLNAYGFLKFLHVVSVIAWVGGVAALSVVAWRMRKEPDRQALTALVRQASIYGERVA